MSVYSVYGGVSAWSWGASFTPILGVSGGSQELISHSVQGERSLPSPFADGYFPCKQLTTLPSQFRGSHQVSFSSLTILLYLIEAFFPLPTLLIFGFGSGTSFCREQLSSVAAQPLLLLLLFQPRKDWACT